MKQQAILITGAAGEIGHALIDYFSNQPGTTVVATDIRADETISGISIRKADVCDPAVWQSLSEEFDFTSIFHLAGILSTGGEKTPERAHEVNVTGSLQLLKLAQLQARERGTPTKFIFPSTIAIYGIPSLEEKERAGKVTEDSFLSPITIYGINKLYVEHLGRYFEQHYKQLEPGSHEKLIDFRGVRFPGLMSAETLPTGGTSDYGSEMIHAAAQGKSYECFVKEATTLPFMVMPDAVKALIDLAESPKESLTRSVYNVTSFSIASHELHELLVAHFGTFEVSYKPHLQRLAIVESWPADVDDSAARNDWNWRPDFNLKESFSDYLIPAIQARYSEQ